VKVSGVARGQWYNLTKKKEKDVKMVNYKIERAVKLGQIAHVYPTGEYIVRYYNLNIMVNGDDILTIWRDRSRPMVNVLEKSKKMYDKAFKPEYLKCKTTEIRIENPCAVNSPIGEPCSLITIDMDDYEDNAPISMHTNENVRFSVEPSTYFDN
jgi:hypothetical protein